MMFKRDNALVGLFVAGGALIFISLMLFLLGYNFTDTRTEYNIRFRKLAGIKKGSDVFLKGFKVGEVSDIQPTFGSDIYFKAQILVDRGLHLYRGTKAVITNQNVIGDAALVLKLPPVKEILLLEGDTIFANQVQSIDSLIGEMAELTSNVNALVRSLGDLTGSNKQGISNILANVNGLFLRINGILDKSEGSMVNTFKNVSKATELTNRVLIDLQRTLKKAQNSFFLR